MLPANRITDQTLPFNIFLAYPMIFRYVARNIPGALRPISILSIIAPILANILLSLFTHFLYFSEVV